MGAQVRVNRWRVYLLISCLLAISFNCQEVAKEPVLEKNDVQGSPLELENYEIEVVSLNLYFYCPGEEGLAREDRETPLAPGKDLPRAVVEELLRGPRDPRLSPVISSHTRLLDAWIQEEIVYLDFSRELVKNFYGGPRAEGLLVYSIVNSLTENTGFQAVQFLVEGKKVPGLAGGQRLDLPVSRDETMVVQVEGCAG